MTRVKVRAKMREKKMRIECEALDNTYTDCLPNRRFDGSISRKTQDELAEWAAATGQCGSRNSRALLTGLLINKGFRRVFTT